MAGDFEIHKYMKDVDAAIRRCNEDETVCAANKAIITTFSKERLARGIGRLRVSKCIYCLRFLARWLKKPYETATKADLIRLIGEMESKPYAEHSKHDFKAVLKLFYKWLKGNDEVYPPEISWLKAKLRNTAHKLPEELAPETAEKLALEIQQGFRAVYRFDSETLRMTSEVWSDDDLATLWGAFFGRAASVAVAGEAEAGSGRGLEGVLPGREYLDYFLASIHIIELRQFYLPGLVKFKEDVLLAGIPKLFGRAVV